MANLAPASETLYLVAEDAMALNRPREAVNALMALGPDRGNDTRFNLLVFGQAAPPGGIPELADQLRVHEVPRDPANDREFARAHIPRPSFYLLRPDGHVGLAGTHLDAEAATGYASARLHLGAQGASPQPRGSVRPQE